jgi:serine phosphatase RsbU (regulator of sigma subunit)
LPTILALGSYTFTITLVLLGLLHFNTFPILRLMNFQVGYLLVSIYHVCLTLFWLSTGVFIVMRANRATRHQARLASEMEAARSVQSMLIPQAIPNIPGFALASVYRPAQEVGGDFFQVIPTPSGDTLIVLGDVSGKGLKAAMAVSLIVGTLRTLADYERDPARLLSGLNRRLTSRLSEGFATCLVLRLAAHGACTLANAGHLPPFLNGRELPVAPSLPVGILNSAEYEDQTIALEPGDRLAIYTDGVLEARNMAGELYGFDRLATLMEPNPDAASIAEAACVFGQDDDITVLTLDRTANASPLSLISEAVTA